MGLILVDFLVVGLLLETPPLVSGLQNAVGWQAVGSSELLEQAKDSCCKNRVSLDLRSVNLASLLSALPSRQHLPVGLRVGQTPEEVN